VNPLAANGGGVRTNKYTVLMDVKFAAGGFQSLLQTGSDHSTGATTGLNANDGDWFLRDDGGLGISGDYTDTGNALRYDAGKWRRLVLTIDTAGTNTYRSFVDGVLQNVVASPSGFGLDKRYSLNSTIGFFADEDGEIRSEWYINNLAIWDSALSDADVRSLGGASAGVVPEPATMAVLSLGVLALKRRRR